MDDLVQWLLAQLTEDKRIARATDSAVVPEGQRHWSVEPVDDAFCKVMADGRYVVGTGEFTPGDAAHVAEWDPARVLREIDAKRQVIAKYTTAVDRMAELASMCERLKAQGKDTFMPEMEQESAIHRRDALKGVLRLLALPYGHRPGYQESWRP